MSDDEPTTGPLIQALAAARRSIGGGDDDLEAALAALRHAEEQVDEAGGPAEPRPVVIDLRSAEGETITLPPAGAEAATAAAPAPAPAPPPPVPAEPEPESEPRPDTGTLWKRSAQGWVRDEDGHTVWRPIVTTTAGVPNWEVDTSLGLVTGESACALQREGLGDMVQSREGNATMRRQLEIDREVAMDGMVDSAVARGAHAVVGVQLEYTFLGECLVVTATGTAVTLRPRS